MRRFKPQILFLCFALLAIAGILFLNRYGGAIARLKDVQDELRRYLSGQLDMIEVLHEEPLSAHRRTFQHYHSFATPMAPVY